MRLTTEQMPAVGFNRQDSLLQADGTGHVCVELLPVLCLTKRHKDKFTQSASACRRHNHQLGGAGVSKCHTLAVKDNCGCSSLRFAVTAAIKRQTSAYLIRLELLSDNPDVLLVLRMDVLLLLPVSQKHIWAEASVGRAWTLREACVPAEQREEPSKEGDTDHNNKQHLVADTFNEGVLILDQVVPTVAVLHYLQT